MDMILLAIIGSKINADTIYWVCYGIYCTIKIVKAICETIEEL